MGRRKVLYPVLLVCAVAALALATVVSGVGPAQARSARHAGHKNAAVVVKTRKLKGLGTVLVTSRGYTLYMFVPDKRKHVTCKGTCAAVWPPLKLKKGARAKAAGAAHAKLLGSDKNPSGGRVVTYARWPLYTYVGDTKPGQAKGQALKLNGGLWYVLSPSGKVVKKH